jgi:sulfite exporter TauE/SafE
MNLWLIFLTGLTSGGVTCAAMQGGLLASVIANQKKVTSSPGLGTDDIAPVSAFLGAKLVSHIILGALLGALGGIVELSLTAKLFFQGFAALFMLATALNLLDVHPIFRYLSFQPPKWAYRLMKNNEKKANLFAPSILGFLTVFIPCGVTQAMAVVALSTSSMIQGALTMGAFVLGTVPLFYLIGIGTSRLSEVWKRDFLRLASYLLIFMAASSLNGILQVTDSPYSIQRLGPQIVRLLPPYDNSVGVLTPDPSVSIENGVQKVTLTVSNGGYSPRYFRVQSGVPVQLTLETDGQVYSCATAFTFKAFDIYDVLKPIDSKVHKFTPEKKGKYTYSCSMGMYSGVMEVI